MPRPSYPLFDHLTRLDAVTPGRTTSTTTDVWSIDSRRSSSAPLDAADARRPAGQPEQPDRIVRDGRRARRGRAASARRAASAIIADEVFADYELEPGARRAAGRPLDRRDVLAFSLGGLSKSVGLPQVKLGWIGVAGPDALVGAALERLELICDTYLSVSTPVQAAAAGLLDARRGVGAQIQARVAANYRRAACDRRGGARLPRAGRRRRLVRGVLQVPTLGSEEDLVLDLARRRRRAGRIPATSSTFRASRSSSSAC